jgi:[protein-PII] uridylyltransferase
MSGAPAPARGERIAEAKNQLLAGLTDWSSAERTQATAYFGENYWLAFDSGELERNARLRTRVATTEEVFALDCAISDVRSVCEVAICTRDSPGLFFKLTGAIAASGGSIVEAKAFTSDDGYALDVFAVQNAESAPFGAGAQIARLRHMISRTLAGQTPPGPPKIRRPGKPRLAAFDVRPRVIFDNEASTLATVLELEGPDRPGLLSEIARALFELRLSISTAIVATYGERAIDVFYVQDHYGNKLDAGEHRERIEARLVQVLSAAS